MYNRQFASLAHYGQEAETPSVEAYYLMNPPSADEYVERWFGHHPPKAPISYFEWSIVKRSEMIAADYAPGGPAAVGVPEDLRLRVLAANAAVLTALRDSKIPRFAYSYQRCLNMARADAGAVEKAALNFYCGSYLDQISARQAVLDAELTAAGSFNSEGTKLAEVVQSSNNEIETAKEGSDLTRSDPNCDWLCQVNRNPRFRRLLWWSGAILLTAVTLPLVTTLLVARASRPQQTIVVREGQSNLYPRGW